LGHAVVVDLIRVLLTSESLQLDGHRPLLQDRKLAILLYGFPPGVGATGTAALLNVPQSLEATLENLRSEGYNLGPPGERIDGEAIISALKMQEDQRAIFEGVGGIERRYPPPLLPLLGYNTVHGKKCSCVEG